MAESGNFERVHMNQAVSTITDGAVQSKVRPDMAGVRADNKKVDTVEVLSPGQRRDQMEAKLENALGDQGGKITCVLPDTPSSC